MATTSNEFGIVNYPKSKNTTYDAFAFQWFIYILSPTMTIVNIMLISCGCLLIYVMYVTGGHFTEYNDFSVHHTESIYGDSMSYKVAEHIAHKYNTRNPITIAKNMDISVVYWRLVVYGLACSLGKYSYRVNSELDEHIQS